MFRITCPSQLKINLSHLGSGGLEPLHIPDLAVVTCDQDGLGKPCQGQNFILIFYLYFVVKE